MKTAATVAIAIALVVIGKAHAADMSPIPAGAPAVAPPVTYGNYAPNAYGNYNWSGIYLGGNGGYSWNEGGSSFLVSNGLTDGLGNLGGWVFGGQIGANWQFGAFVTGLEGDLQWSGERSTNKVACGTDCTITGSVQTDAFATVRARAGIAFELSVRVRDRGRRLDERQRQRQRQRARRVRRSEPLRQQGGLDSWRRRRSCAHEQLDRQARVSLYRHRQYLGHRGNTADAWRRHYY